MIYLLDSSLLRRRTLYAKQLSLEDRHVVRNFDGINPLRQLLRDKSYYVSIIGTLFTYFPLT